MLLLLFLAWIIFNGQLTAEILVFGVVICSALFAFICGFLGHSIRRELAIYRRLPLYGRYLWLLLKEIVQANLGVCRLILTRKEVAEPVLVRIPTDLKTETARVILANSITLTPGTITVSLTERELLVHCLDKSLAGGMADSDFVKLLRQIEEAA